MRSIAPLRAAKIGYIVMSVLFCLLGLVLLVWPNLSISLIGIAAGIMLIVFGLVKLGAISPGISTSWRFSTTWPSGCC